MGASNPSAPPAPGASNAGPHSAPVLKNTPNSPQASPGKIPLLKTSSGSRRRDPPHHWSSEMQGPSSQLEVKHNKSFTKDGIMAYKHALRKYHFEAPYTLSSAFFQLTNRQYGKDSESESLRRTISHDIENEVGVVAAEEFQEQSPYLCKVTVGENDRAVTMFVQIDTGSSSLWGRTCYDSRDHIDTSFLIPYFEPIQSIPWTCNIQTHCCHSPEIALVNQVCRPFPCIWSNLQSTDLHSLN